MIKICCLNDFWRIIPIDKSVVFQNFSNLYAKLIKFIDILNLCTAKAYTQSKPDIIKSRFIHLIISHIIIPAAAAAF